MKNKQAEQKKAVDLDETTVKECKHGWTEINCHICEGERFEKYEKTGKEVERSNWERKIKAVMELLHSVHLEIGNWSTYHGIDYPTLSKEGFELLNKINNSLYEMENLLEEK